MPEEFSIESLRAAIKGRGSDDKSAEAARFEALARSYERAVRDLLAEVSSVVKEIPELAVSLEDEVERFTSPAFAGHATKIESHRLRITLGEDFLLFDPTAGALASALGQVKLSASGPIPFLIEKTLYLIRSRDAAEPAYWAYRSSEDPGRFATPFSRSVLLRLLHTVFA